MLQIRCSFNFNFQKIFKYIRKALKAFNKFCTKIYCIVENSTISFEYYKNYTNSLKFSKF